MKPAERPSIGFGAAVAMVDADPRRGGCPHLEDGGSHAGGAYWTLMLRSTAAPRVFFRTKASGPISTSPFFTTPGWV